MLSPWPASATGASSSSPGSGRGIGRAHALELARQGARVVVNDLGCELDGTGGGTGPAGEVVEEIRAAGGEAVANGDDVADWDGAGRLVADAPSTRSATSTPSSTTPASCATACSPTPARTSGTPSCACTSRATSAWPATPPPTGATRPRPGDAVDARIVNTSSGAGHPRLGRPGRLLRGQGRHRHPHARAGRRARPLRRDRQRALPRRPHPHDRGRVHRDDGRAVERGAVRRHGAGERRRRSSPGWCRPSRPTSPAGCSRSRAARSASPPAGSTARPSTRATAGTPAELGPVVDELLAEAPDPAPVYGTG